MGVFNSPSNLLARQAAIVALVVFATAGSAVSVTAPDQARVTKVVHDVKLLPEGAKAKPANIND